MIEKDGGFLLIIIIESQISTNQSHPYGHYVSFSLIIFRTRISSVRSWEQNGLNIEQLAANKPLVYLREISYW
jgi:hypothetical protein